ncbi:hypothetical protein [Actinomadura geliboluensis]|uniref:hypothetical protein n=1 Tax=Actinomadura geliboluensis TaxID=882440 RepID=UPI003712D33D
MNLDGTVNVSVKLSWQFIGDITLDIDDNITFPSMRSIYNRGGVYRIVGRRPVHATGTSEQPSRWWLYIGQSGNIQARMNKYRNPSPDQKTNVRINSALRFELERGTEVALFIAHRMEIKVGRQWMNLDTGSTTQRTLAECAALIQTYQTENLLDVDLLNRGLDDSVDREFKDIPWPH